MAEFNKNILEWVNCDNKIKSNTKKLPIIIKIAREYIYFSFGDIFFKKLIRIQVYRI